MDIKIENLSVSYGKKTVLKNINLTIPRKQIEASILNPVFAYHFSDTVWKNKDRLVAFVNTEVRKGLVQGTDVRKTAKKLMEQEGVTKYQARRLVVSESGIARTKGSLDGYAEAGVEKVIVLVTMDKKTCPKCKDYENYVVEVKKGVIGDDLPPYHAGGCRCSIAPYFDE
jgi:SPP1 gp7 family putative phage head morphogenesis protein